MNYNPKSAPSPRQQIKLIQEKQKLLAIAMQAAGSPIGSEAVAELMQQSMLSPRQLIKLIQEKQKLLVIAMQASGGSIGLKAVRELMHLNFPITQASPTMPEIFEEVKSAEVEFTPGLVALVKNSPYQNVQNSIAIFKTYPKSEVKTSAGLFYKILVNENLGTSKAAS